MQQIVDGDRILIDWMNKLETSMYIGFTLSNGEKLMEYYYLPIVHSHVECVWGFNPFNPHVERLVIGVFLSLFCLSRPLAHKRKYTKGLSAFSSIK